MLKQAVKKYDLEFAVSLKIISSIFYSAKKNIINVLGSMIEQCNMKSLQARTHDFE